MIFNFTVNENMSVLCILAGSSSSRRHVLKGAAIFSMEILSLILIFSRRAKITCILEKLRFLSLITMIFSLFFELWYGENCSNQVERNMKNASQKGRQLCKVDEKSSS
jgi:hypothetical protein